MSGQSSSHTKGIKTLENLYTINLYFYGKPGFGTTKNNTCCCFCGHRLTCWLIWPLFHRRKKPMSAFAVCNCGREQREPVGHWSSQDTHPLLPLPQASLTMLPRALTIDTNTGIAFRPLPVIAGLVAVACNGGVN